LKKSYKKNPEEDLAFLLHNNSKQLCINIRLEYKISVPSYNVVRNIKKNLRSSKEVITISENIAEISMQELLNLTIKKIIELQKDILLRYAQTANCVNNKIKMVLISSWNFEYRTLEI